MTDAELRELAREWLGGDESVLCDSQCHAGGHVVGCDAVRLTPSLTALLSRVQREALEAAARLMGHEGMDVWKPKFCRTAEHVQGMCECSERAAAIRALMEPVPQKADG